MLDSLFGEEDDANGTPEVQIIGSAPTRERLVKPPAPRSTTGFVGLENQGATCYLNSLIQAMYMTPELRNGLLDIDPNELGADAIEDYEKEQKEIKSQGVVEPDEKLLETLLSFGVPENRAKRALVATKNSGMDDVFAYMEQHENDPDIDKPLPETVQSKKKKKKPRLIPLELQNLFTKLKFIDCKAISTEDLTTKGFQWQGLDGQVQHDAHELNRLLIDALEKSLKKTSGEDLCKELYEGKVSNQILCMTCKTISTREEAFYDLNLQIIDCQDTAESLRQYCRAEVLSGDSAYQCDVCRVKRTALRASVICDIPRILTFSCSRFRIDKSTNWNRVKVTSKNEFPLIINMTAFMNRKDGINDAIDEAEAEKQMVEILRREKMSWLRIASTKADEWAQKLVEKFGEKQPAQYLALLTDNEIASILREIIGTSVDCAYEDKLFLLQAVIMHRGSAHSGHYFAYIRDSMAEGKWDIDSTSAAFFSSSNDSVKGKKGSKKKSSNVSIEIDGVCMTSDVVNGAARMLKSHEFFVEDTGDSHLIYIDETSPAGILVKLINQHSSVKYDTGSNNKRRHLSDSGISLHKLGVEFTSAQGRSWSELHHEKCGPLTKFMKGLPQIFRVMKSKVLLADNLVSLSAADYKEMTKKDAVQSSSSTTVDMEVVDEDMMCDSDEALARALQDKEYDDVKIFDDSASTTAAADDAEWEEVSATKKKDKKKRNNPNIPAKKVENSSKIVNSPTTNKKLEDTELVKISVAKPELLEIPVKSLTMQKLAAYLLSLVFGNFFEFNDSLIRAMPLYGLEKAFEGPDSAYLLVYRAIDLQSDIILPALGMKNSCTVSVKTNSTTSKFDYWTKKIQQENESLAKQRLEYEVKHSRMIIRIFCPGQFRYVHPFLMSVDIDYGEKMLDHGETIQTTSDRVKIVAFKSNCIEVDVDGRMYLKELIETLVASLDVSLLDLLEIKPTMEKENSSYPLVLSPVSKCGKGFHSSVSLDHQLLVSDTIDKGPNFLLWDGLSIGNERVLVGSEALPISVAVYKLDSNGGQSKNKTQSIQIVNRNDEYWIPGNLTLETLAVEIARQMQIELESLCLHILADKDLQANSSNSSETRSKKHRVKATLSTAIKLFDGRTFTGKPLIVKKYGSGYGLPLSVLLSGTTTVKELGSGTQLLVEHTEGRAFKQQSLAEQYVESLNTTITFKVRLLKPAIKDDNVKAVTNEVILLDDTEAEEKNTCQLTISETEPLSQLKEKAIQAFNKQTQPVFFLLSTAAENLEGSCIKESLTANDNGLKEGMTLFLKEEGVAYTEDIKLNAILVINNSNEHRYLKMDQVGNRIEKKTITISTNTEVQQLRDKLGVLFLNYEEGWTKRSVECIPDCYILENNSEHFTSETVVAAGDKSDVAAIGYGVQENGNEVNKNSTIIDLTEDSMDVPPDTKLDRPYKGGRLRTTTWMKECGELIGEVNSKGHARTLKEAGVKDGDTVLFEEGDLPTKGQMTFKVFVWKPDTLASSPSTNASSFREMSMNDKSDSVTEESTSLAMEVSKTETALEYADRIRRSVLSELCTVVANEEVSLVTLHNLVYNYIVNSNSLDCYELSEEKILFRELRPDLLPGRSLWTCEPRTDLNTMDAISAIGKKGINPAVTKPAIPSQSLKKHNLRSDRNLVVEVLPVKQVDVRPVAGTFRVWVQRLINPGAPKGMSKMAPCWPPKQVSVNGGTSPGMAHLRNAISSAFADIPTSKMVIFKYLPQSIEWKEMVSAGASSINSMMILAAKRKGSKAENITLAPYSVKEGDQFCVFNRDEICSGGKNVTETDPNFVVALPEEILLLELRKAIKLEKKSRKSVGFLDSFPKPGNRKEVTLSLGSNFDFSDEED